MGLSLAVLRKEPMEGPWAVPITALKKVLGAMLMELYAGRLVELCPGWLVESYAEGRVESHAGELVELYAGWRVEPHAGGLVELYAGWLVRTWIGPGIHLGWHDASRCDWTATAYSTVLPHAWMGHGLRDCPPADCLPAAMLPAAMLPAATPPGSRCRGRSFGHLRNSQITTFQSLQPHTTFCRLA